VRARWGRSMWVSRSTSRHPGWRLGWSEAARRHAQGAAAVVGGGGGAPAVVGGEKGVRELCHGERKLAMGSSRA